MYKCSAVQTDIPIIFHTKMSIIIMSMILMGLFVSAWWAVTLGFNYSIYVLELIEILIKCTYKYVLYNFILSKRGHFKNMRSWAKYYFITHILGGFHIV